LLLIIWINPFATYEGFILIADNEKENNSRLDYSPSIYIIGIVRVD
jgi:hypothetical protein